MFRKADLDMDGFVSGQEIRDIFLQSGLQNNVLAHIWYASWEQFHYNGSQNEGNLELVL